MRYDKAHRKLNKVTKDVERYKKQIVEATEEKDRIVDILDNTMHEVRTLTAELVNHSSFLARKVSEDDLSKRATTAQNAAEMISARLAYTDIQINPDALSRQPRVRAGLYKKFEKSKYVLAERAHRKGLSVKFSGRSYGEFDALQSFELIPFVIMDNAIKYSPPDQAVEVEFYETQKILSASVSSLGPMLKPGEEGKVFDPSFRGENAKGLGVYGGGLGLNIAEGVSKLHDGISLKVSASKVSQFELNGVPYSNFKIEVKVAR